MVDHLRPHSQPAQLIYDAIVSEAEKRDGVDPGIWIPAERENVWRVARDYAQQNGLRAPTMAEVERAEASACGHIDYAAKWAHRVSEIFRNI